MENINASSPLSLTVTCEMMALPLFAKPQIVLWPLQGPGSKGGWSSMGTPDGGLWALCDAAPGTKCSDSTTDLEVWQGGALHPRVGGASKLP